MNGKPFLFAVVGGVAAALLAVWLLKPNVDRLWVTLGVGFSEGTATPETSRFAEDLERFLSPADLSAAFALLVILAGGLPLAVLAWIAHHWRWMFGPLSRNANVIWLFLTLEMTNVLLPPFSFCCLPSKNSPPNS